VDPLLSPLYGRPPRHIYTLVLTSKSGTAEDAALISSRGAGRGRRGALLGKLARAELLLILLVAVGRCINGIMRSLEPPNVLAATPLAAARGTTQSARSLDGEVARSSVDSIGSSIWRSGGVGRGGGKASSLATLGGGMAAAQASLKLDPNLRFCFREFDFRFSEYSIQLQRLWNPTMVVRPCRLSPVAGVLAGGWSGHARCSGWMGRVWW
jgi:hypothetical protein